MHSLVHYSLQIAASASVDSHLGSSTNGNMNHICFHMNYNDKFQMKIL